MEKNTNGNLPAHDFNNERLAAALAAGKLVESDCYWTPRYIFEALTDEDGEMLRYDLDPCSPGLDKTFVPAGRAYSLEQGDDGLADPWFGRVWLNAPYSKKARIDLWMKRFQEHGNGIALVNSNTDSKWFQNAMATSDATLFTSGRISFINAATGKPQHGNAKGQAFFAIGEENVAALERSSLGEVTYSSAGLAKRLAALSAAAFPSRLAA